MLLEHVDPPLESNQLPDSVLLGTRDSKYGSGWETFTITDAVKG